MNAFSMEAWGLYAEWLDKYVHEFEATCDKYPRLRGDGFDQYYGTCAWCTWGSHHQVDQVDAYNLFPAAVAAGLTAAVELQKETRRGRTSIRVHLAEKLATQIREYIQMNHE